MTYFFGPPCSFHKTLTSPLRILQKFSEPHNLFSFVLPSNASCCIWSWKSCCCWQHNVLDCANLMQFTTVQRSQNCTFCVQNCKWLHMSSPQSKNDECSPVFFYILHVSANVSVLHMGSCRHWQDGLTTAAAVSHQTFVGETAYLNRWLIVRTAGGRPYTDNEISTHTDVHVFVVDTALQYSLYYTCTPMTSAAHFILRLRLWAQCTALCQI